MANEAFSFKFAFVRWAGWATVRYGRVGKLKTRVGKRKNFLRRFAPNFAHPGLKPCRRPCQRGSGRSPDRPKFSTIFSTQASPDTIILLIVDCHAAIWGKTPVRPLPVYAPGPVVTRSPCYVILYFRKHTRNELYAYSRLLDTAVADAIAAPETVTHAQSFYAIFSSSFNC